MPEELTRGTVNTEQSSPGPRAGEVGTRDYTIELSTLGPQGPRGATWSAAAGPPTDLTGNLQDDLYLDTVSGTVWEWSGTAWVSVGSLKGPPGVAGAVGPPGPQGPTGLPSTVPGPTGP